MRLMIAQALVIFVVTLCAPPAAEASEFIRGDANTDGIVDVADVLYTLNFQFSGGPIRCEDALDSNDSGDLDLSDGLYSLAYLFSFGDEPPAPFDWCGEDPTADALGCDSNQTCDLGGPIEGLTDAQLRAFNRGREIMTHRFTPSEGLGNPTYNTTSCEACHSTPTIGGSSPLYRNFYLVALGDPPTQTRDPNVPSMAFPSYAGFEAPRPTIPVSTPDTPVVVAHRNAPPMFGVGLFEFVSNGTIIGGADPNDLFTPDGISGRFNTDTAHIGRFGYKAQANFIESFIRGAMFNQMGITSDPVAGSDGVVKLALLKQITVEFDEPKTDSDGVPDPEIPPSDMADLITFNIFLRPPHPQPFGPDEIAGEQLFSDVGCDKCHRPELPSAVGPLGAYSDLLLHDLGPDLADGISMGSPQLSIIAPNHTANEFRTQPLWGVSMSGPWLHDGRADSLEEAILWHAGEAAGVIADYEALTADEKENLIKFLEAL